MTETGWYNGDQNPVRAGVYKCRICHRNGHAYAWWSGKYWGLARYTVMEAYLTRSEASTYQYLSWCGLTKEPK